MSKLGRGHKLGRLEPLPRDHVGGEKKRRPRMESSNTPTYKEPTEEGKSAKKPEKE